MNTTDCPVCHEIYTEYSSVPKHVDVSQFNCANCGRYRIPGLDQLGLQKLTAVDRAVLSYFIRRNQIPEQALELDQDAIGRILGTERLPTPMEQAENFVLWLGNQLRSIGSIVETVQPSQMRATLGCLNTAAVTDLYSYLVKERLVEAPTQQALNRSEITHVRLSMDGWKEYQRLTSERTDSRIAFMAMPFGKSEVTTACNDCFRRAVARAGFELHTVDELSDTGLIDDHIAVGIMRSAFVIADLTHDNRGAYWEAGFAEGLKRPVFYTCERSFFNDGKGVHFNTQHMVTTLWTLDNLQDAEQELVDRIRRKLPDRAELED